MPLAPGSRLGEYEIVALLGAGGMGEVFRARDPRLGREVAIKVLSAAGAGDPGLLQRLKQEARTVAALNHPSLLAIYDIGEYQNSPFLVMELLEGETLRAKLAQGKLPVRRAVAIARNIAQGLAAAHEQGIIHRDLKPENIFLLSDGRAKILDFGLAKALPGAGATGEAQTMAMAPSAATMPGMVLGTAGYMAPEQVRGEAATARSDIFALGAVLYEMLSGERAFKAASSMEVLTAILRDEPPEISLTGTALPAGLDRLVRRCLEKDPRQRFQTAADLEFALAAVEEPTSLSSSLAMPALAGAAAPHAPQGTNWTRIALAAVAASALTALFALNRSGRDLTQVRLEPFAATTTATTAAWSPDGNAVAYADAPASGDPDQVFVRYLNNPAPIQVTHGTGVSAIFGWSGDGQSIVFNDPAGTIWSVAAVGGTPRKLYAFPARSELRVGAISAHGWAVLQADANERYEIYTAPVGGPPAGSPWTLYQPAPFAAKQIINQPQLAFSPDGKQLLLFINAARGNEEAWLLPLPADAKNPPRRVFRNLAPHSFTTFFSWMPDSRHVVMDATARGGEIDVQLFLGDIRTGRLQQLTATLTPLFQPSVSPDGARVIAGRTTGSFEVVAAQLSNAVVEPILANGADNVGPGWASHQPVLLYETGGPAGPRMWLLAKDSSGATQERLVPNSDPPGTLALGPVLSPNADRILYARFGTSTGDVKLYIASTAGGNPVRLTSDSNVIEVGPTWSPDGSQAAFIAVHGNNADLMVAPTSGQAPARLLRRKTNNFIPVWSPDGNWIAYQSANNQVLQLVSPDGKQDRALGKFESPAAAFSSDSRSLYGIVSEPHHNYLVQMDVATGAQRRIGDMGPDFTPHADSNPTMRFTLTPDGKSLTFPTARRVSSLWMMTNFDPPPRGAAWLRSLLHLP